MFEFEHSVLINRPPEDVFAFVLDPSNDPLWQTSVVESRQVTDGPVGVGTRFTEVRHFLGRRMETTVEVTEHEDDRRSAVKFVSGPIPGSGSYSIKPADGGTRFTWTVQADPSGFFKLAEPVLARMMRRELSTNCENLKDVLEGGA